MLVSIKMKNTGPIVKAKIIPKEIAIKIVSIIAKRKSKYSEKIEIIKEKQKLYFLTVITSKGRSMVVPRLVGISSVKVCKLKAVKPTESNNSLRQSGV